MFSALSLSSLFFWYFQLLIVFLNAEYADSSQRAQTGWECGDDANYVSYATIPARFIYLIKTQTDIVS
ncbi:MAG: hypothetical protein IJH67_15350 [Thermoguttaceae bacterium]|nr:hypothetical protein [Thermoguttaceae bacterium]